MICDGGCGQPSNCECQPNPPVPKDTGGAAPPPDHEERMRAEAFARWQLSNRAWGGLILGAYIRPAEEMTRLGKEEGR